MLTFNWQDCYSFLKYLLSSIFNVWYQARQHLRQQQCPTANSIESRIQYLSKNCHRSQPCSRVLENRCPCICKRKLSATSDNCRDLCGEQQQMNKISLSRMIWTINEQAQGDNDLRNTSHAYGQRKYVLGSHLQASKARQTRNICCLILSVIMNALDRK